MTDTKPNVATSVFVAEPAGDSFAPRTRKATVDALAAAKPALETVKANPAKVYTIAKGITPAKASALVSLLNNRYPAAFTFGARTTDDGKAVVQAKYDTNKPRPIRKTTPRKPKATAKATVRK